MLGLISVIPAMVTAPETALKDGRGQSAKYRQVRYCNGLMVLSIRTDSTGQTV